MKATGEGSLAAMASSPEVTVSRSTLLFCNLLLHRYLRKISVLSGLKKQGEKIGCALCLIVSDMQKEGAPQHAVVPPKK